MQLGSDAESDVDDQEEDAGLPSLRNILEGLCRFSVHIVELDTDLRTLNSLSFDVFTLFYSSVSKSICRCVRKLFFSHVYKTNLSSSTVISVFVFEIEQNLYIIHKMAVLLFLSNASTAAMIMCRSMDGFIFYMVVSERIAAFRTLPIRT